MKSSIADLRKRGFISDGELEAFLGLPSEELRSVIASSEPGARTAAVVALGRKRDDRDSAYLCGLLKDESRLYTRLAICEALVGLGGAAIPHLVGLLGAIGKNQHRKATLVDLDKASFPLPRDIAARILIRMGPAVLPFMIAELSARDGTRLPEAIDVIGHITLSSRDYSAEPELLELFAESGLEELIRWKIIRAFQSFDGDRVVCLLARIVETEEDSVLMEEAKRSLRRIASRQEPYARRDNRSLVGL